MKTTILLILTLLSCTVISQNIQIEVPRNSKCMKITSYNMVIKPIIFSLEPTEFSDLKRIVLKKDPYINLPTYDYTQTKPQKALFNFNIEVGLASNPNRELLIGVGYISGNRRSFKFNKESVRRLDTLNVKDYTFYVDSFYHSSLNYSESVEEMGLNISYIYKSDAERKFRLFAGYGINAGYSTYSAVTYTFEQDSSERLMLKNDQNNTNHYYNKNAESRHSVQKRIETDPSFFLRAYIPFGFILQLSKKNAFWKHVNLQFHGQFGLEYRNISDDIAFTRVYWSLGGLGLKFSF